MEDLEERRKKTEAGCAFSPEELAVLAAICRITASGRNAEVKRNKDGGLTVYRIKKEIEI